MNNIRNKIIRDQIVFDDENNPSTSLADIIWPRTVFDAVYDQSDPNEITLRKVLDEMKEEIKNNGTGYIKFPVTSVNGMYDDVNITQYHIGLGRVNNTSDMEKPLSDIQRNAVMSILENYNFNIDLSALISHINNHNNPHNVTLDQLNLDGSVSNMINNLISVHDESGTAHDDIRTSITNISNQLYTNTNTLDERIVELLNNYTDHLINPASHATLFGYKENISNKVNTISKITNYDEYKYPSSKAVVDYITTVTNDFNVGPDITEYVSYLDVLNGNSDLPVASESVFRKAFLLKNRDDSSYSAIAVCRKNGETYWWDIRDFTVSKYDSEYFTNTTNGLSLNISALPQSVDAYDKTESDTRFIHSIEIGPGSDNGSIAYIINDDPSTLVDEIHVSGLEALAYKAVADSDDIKAAAILPIHLSDNCVMYNHIADGSVSSEKIAGNAIRDYHILQGSIKTPAIEDRTVTGDKIAAYTITYDNLAEGCINNDKIQKDSVTGYNILDDTISTIKLQNKSIINSKLADMAAYSIKGNMGSAVGVPTDIQFTDIIDSIISKSSIAQLQLYADKLKPYAYQHPANHPPAIITQDVNNRFVTDAQISLWNSKADSGHTHDYLPLTGGTITGDLTVLGTIEGAQVLNAVWNANDYAELFKKDDINEEYKPGDIIALNPETGNYMKSNEKNSPLVVGVVSEDYGYLIGGDENLTRDENLNVYIPIGLSGRVDVNIIGKIKAGELISSSDIIGVGMATEYYSPGCIIGKALQTKQTDDIGKVKMLILNR